MRTKSIALATVVPLMLALTGCGGGSDKPPGKSPTQVMTQAKKLFDEATSVHLSLHTSSRPTKGNAVLSADGVGTHQPAFKGTVQVVISGLTANVPVVSVGRTVKAKLPLTIGYNDLDPAQYDAPNPSDFMDPDKGISALLTQLKSPKRTGTARAGSKVVTTYAGTLDGSAVKEIIPSAGTGKSYATTANVDSSGRVTTVRITGAFFSAKGDVTYDLAFDDYGRDVKISLP